MTTRASGTFNSASWDEQTYQELEGQVKLARATITFVYNGDIEGESRSAGLFAYPEGGVCQFVGHDLITGRIGDRSGSFVLQIAGTFSAGQLEATWFVVPGSGTGELRGLRGSGGYAHKSDDGENVPYTLDYEFE